MTLRTSLKYLLLLVILAGGMTYVILSRHKINPCYGTSSQINGNEKLILSSVIKFSGEHGYLKLTGDYFIDGLAKAHVAREVSFRFTIENNEFKAVSESVVTRSDDTMDKKLLPGYFADFFLRKDRGLNLKLKHTETNGLVFFIDDSPVLYCNKE
ncbi:hypothetical protein KMW40_20200 [Enterobacter cloacae]|uniref:hypothetical protein n=1 Tax=Enterobacter cloacae TaxID=550 RepID=UPI0034A27AF3